MSRGDLDVSKKKQTTHSNCNAVFSFLTKPYCFLSLYLFFFPKERVYRQHGDGDEGEVSRV